MFERLRRFSIACLLCCTALRPRSAQGLQTAVVGLVRDASGGVIPGVTVTVTNRATGVARTAVTDAEGNFLVTSLVAGRIRRAAELSGFKTAVRKNVPVQTDDAVRVDFTLEVGAVGETVEVQAAADTQHPPHRGRLARRRAVGEPGAGSPGQEPQLHGARAARAGRHRGARGQPEHARPHPAAQPLGARPAHFDNNIRLDGVSIIAGFANGSTFIPSLESLKEVSVQTGQYGAAYGMYSGRRSTWS